MSTLDNILVIIPVRNEESTIATVIQSLQTLGLNQIRVVDNGSTDASAHQAQAAGAEVIFEPIPGYGRACGRGLQQLPPEIEWILFCDGDGSDDLSKLPEFFAQRDNCELIIGDRSATLAGRKAMTPVQKFGNRLASLLINWGWGYQYHDLGPLRLISRSGLEKIQMQDRGMGWTVEMQVRAVECDLRICELPVSYRLRQGGKSKISGTVTGSIKAGMVILSTIASLFLRRQLHQKKNNFFSTAVFQLPVTYSRCYCYTSLRRFSRFRNSCSFLGWYQYYECRFCPLLETQLHPRHLVLGSSSPDETVTAGDVSR